MKISDDAFEAVKIMLDFHRNDKGAKALFEAWLEENCYPAIYDEAWQEFCDKYDIDDDYYADEEAEA